MKKWLIRIGAALSLIVIAIAVIILFIENDRAMVTKYIRNENLPIVKADWRGTPVDQKGRFVNHEFPFLPKITSLLKWRLSGNPQEEEKRNDVNRLKIEDPTEFLNSEKDGILWLGHASFLIRLNGVSVITDPVFGEPSFIEKYVDVPIPIEKIRRIDYVLLSHDHRDHCDEDTIRQIARKFPNAKFLAGLGMEDILSEWKTDSNEVQTAGWFQQFDTKAEDLKIVFVPVRHWCRRGFFDTNKRLWGGFVISGAEKTIYFGGDSGFGSHYKETAEIFPEIDYFLIGIGAYQPRWFMEPTHNTPEEALKGLADIKAEFMIPMHYGTFDLSDEPPGEPLKLLKEKAAEMNLSDKIKMLNINESVYLNE